MSRLRARRLLSVFLIGLPAALAFGKGQPPAETPAVEALAPDPATPSASPDAVDASMQDTATPPSKPAVSYEPLRGVVFRTPDDLFEASLGFNLQTRFTHFDFDTSTTGVDSNEFRVRRFKLFMSGSPSTPA